MRETALIPTESLAFFVILAESEGVGIDKQRVCACSRIASPTWDDVGDAEGDER